MLLPFNLTIPFIYSRLQVAGKAGLIQSKKVVAFEYWPEFLKLDWAKVGIFAVGGIDKSTHGTRFLFDTDITAKACIIDKNIAIYTRDMWLF